MPFTKGNKLGKGRTKGSTNKIPAALKDLILGALQDVGGQEYLAAQAQKNPQAFLSLIGRVLPLQIKEGGADPVMPKTVYHDRIG